jgi:hypothetical protein
MAFLEKLVNKIYRHTLTKWPINVSNLNNPITAAGTFPTINDPSIIWFIISLILV